jgi:hypothetical protein
VLNEIKSSLLMFEFVSIDVYRLKTLLNAYLKYKYRGFKGTDGNILLVFMTMVQREISID